MAEHPTLAAEDAQLLIDRADSGFVVTDHNAKITYCNSRFADWTGNTPDVLVGKRVSHLLDVPGRVFFDTHIMPMILLQGFAREILCRLAPRGAERFPILLNASRHPADEGPESRIVFNIFDATERAMYEGDLRKARDDAEELAAVVRSAQLSIFRINNRGQVKTWNPWAVTMFGFDSATAAGRPITEIAPLRRDPGWLETVKAQALSGDGPEFFAAETEDGRNLSISITPITETRFRALEPDFSLLMRDITQQVQTERQIKIVLSELNHRVKNNFAVVTSIARQTFRSEASKGEAARFFARLQTLAKSHDLLVSSNWQSISIREMAELTATDSGVEEQFDLQGPDVIFEPQSVAMLALALFELMTNAIKYGALSQSGGRVKLHWELRGAGEDQTFRLRWEEQDGPPVTAPEGHFGFGSKLVKQLVAAELGGSAVLEFAPGGLIYTLEAPYQAP